MNHKRVCSKSSPCVRCDRTHYHPTRPPSCSACPTEQPSTKEARKPTRIIGSLKRARSSVDLRSTPDLMNSKNSVRGVAPFFQREDISRSPRKAFPLIREAKYGPRAGFGQRDREGKGKNRKGSGSLKVLKIGTRREMHLESVGITEARRILPAQGRYFPVARRALNGFRAA